jgi:ABC-type multidrug transport system fused ATPase/permease subunit
MDARGWPLPLTLDLAQDQIVRGKAFSIAFRVLALLLIEGMTWWAFVLWRNGKLGLSFSNSSIWFLAALILMLITVVYVFRSMTSVTNSHLRQSWIWDKEMRVDELAYAKLIRLRGFDWLIAPRLYARTHGGKFASFYASTPDVLAQFENISRKLSNK